MPYQTKKGNGGHGLEVYDTETGKYAQISINFEGESFDNWEQLKDFLISKDQGSLNAYNNIPEIKKQIDDYVQDELYPQLLQEEVDQQNENAGSKKIFDSPAETVQNLDVVFSNNVLQQLLDNNIINCDAVIINKKMDYTVDTLSAVIQLNRYKKGKMNPITRQEYLQRKIQENKTKLHTFSSLDDTRSFINNSKEIVIIRSVGDFFNQAEREEIKRSYYDENSPFFSCLSHSRKINNAWYGSCIYFSTGGFEYGWQTYNSLSIEGIVKNENLKLAEIDTKSSNTRSKMVPVAEEFRKQFQINEFFIKEKMQQKFAKKGLSSFESEILFTKIKNKINDDPSFCCMLMGYDALYGNGYHFDILNPSIVDIVKD